METFTKEQVITDFAELLQMSKEILVSRKVLTRRLYELKLKYNYIRTAYQLNLPRVYRARAVSVGTVEEAEKEFSNLKKLSFPSKEFLHKVGIGRCNWSKQAVFYCSNETGVPIFEIRPNVNDYVVLVYYKHKSRDEIKMYTPVISIKQIIEKLSSRDQTENLVKIIKTDPMFKSGNERLIQIDDLCSDWFVQNVNDSNIYFYRLTCALFSIVIDTYIGDSNRMDGLVYPSTTSEITGVNIALTTDFVSSNLAFEKAVLYQLEKKEGKEMDLRIVKEAFEDDIDHDGNIKWQETNGTGLVWYLSPETPTFTLDRAYFST